MSSPSPTPSPTVQPKVVQRLLIRTLVLVVVLGGILIAIRNYRDSRADPSAHETAATAGYLGAIQYKDDGQQVVVIKPDLSIQPAEGWKKGATDRDLAWAPSGNFLFFISDRGDDAAFQLYRWNPSKSEPEMRSQGKRGRSNPSFALGQSDADQSMLITSSGLVMELDPTTRAQVQVLPPVGREITVSNDDEGGEGAQSQFASMYGAIGTSFREARYASKDDYIVAIMRRDEGEALIAQSLKPLNNQPVPPEVIAAGDHIDFDVNPADGSVIYSVQSFQWPSKPPPEFVKNGRVTKPFFHFVGIWTADQPSQPPVVASPDDSLSFGQIAINPDGKDFVVVIGKYENGGVNHEGLVTFPAKSSGANEGKSFARGPIYEPSWDPTGKLLAYVKPENGKRTIFTASRDGSSERNMTGDKGDFAFPKFSPQER
jgi:hypothetical protein